MSFDDDEKRPVTGMTDHVERYKRYLQKLKTGKSSGISSTFGAASDLLDSEAAEVLVQRARAFSKGDVIMRSRMNVEDLMDAVEQITHELHPSVGQCIDTKDGPMDVVGAFYDDDQLMLVLADLTVIPAPNTVAEQECEAREPSAPQTVASSPRKTEPDIRVSAPNGMWLWDIYYEGDAPAAIETADGSLIQRTEYDQLYVMAEPNPNQRFPKITILEHLAVDPLTGNIFWQGLHSSKAGAFLNNGWQFEQNVAAAADIAGDTFFATKPLSLENPERERFQVYDLEVDPIAGEVSFIYADSKQLLKSRRL